MHRDQVPGHETGRHEGDALVTKARGVDGRTMHEGFHAAHPVHAPQELAQGVKVVEVVELRGVAAPARVEGEAKPVVLPETGAAVIAVEAQGRHHRQLLLHQGKAERVLLANLFIAPALGAVELGDQRRAVLDAHLIDAVFVAVEGEKAAIAEKPGALHRRHDPLRAQTVKGVLGGRDPLAVPGAAVVRCHIAIGVHQR